MLQLCFIDIVMLQVLSTTVNDDYRAKKTRELASFFRCKTSDSPRKTARDYRNMVKLYHTLYKG